MTLSKQDPRDAGDESPSSAGLSGSDNPNTAGIGNDLASNTNDGYRFGSVPGYFQNPPILGGNPNSGGAAGQYSGGNDYSLANEADLASANLANMTGGTDSMPTAEDYLADSGVDYQIVPDDKQK